MQLWFARSPDYSREAWTQWKKMTLVYIYGTAALLFGWYPKGGCK